MEFISGPNFSGRSAALMESLRTRKPAFLIGPYAEAALSGLSGTVADEVDIYRVPSPGRPVFAPLDLAAYAARKPPTLSGGEQVLLALQCFSQSDYATIGIDTALEQLDPGNRHAALDYLTDGPARGFDATLIDNTLECPPGWTEHRRAAQAPAFACDLAAVTATLEPRAAPTIAVAQLSFRYPGGRDIFRALDLTLGPGNVYRLSGPNGAGKSTLFRLLAGVLAPLSGSIGLDGVPYAPWRSGNSVFALATQNPDHQWCGATLAEDMGRRRGALARFPGVAVPGDDRLAELARHLGITSLDQHLYELPLVARKRLSWLMPLTGAMPWIMLDEPSVGQDRATRNALAAAILRLAALGHGVVFVTHDDAFAGSIPHRSIALT
jgi:energy-coupling factor transporter ATP-binding protein EcfA2